MKSDGELPSGNPELIALIRRQIEASGPMTFARFMELALYHPEHGYYASGRARIGRHGDFFTNVSVGAIFGRLLAAQFAEVWEEMGGLRDFTIIEQGAHDGQFAADVLRALGESDCFRSLNFIIVEPFSIWRRRQQEKLRAFREKVSWISSIDELEPFMGVHFSNELFDALPAHLRNEQGRECFVTIKGAEFRLDDTPTVESTVAASNLMGQIARKLVRGVILTVDYGFAREQVEGTTGTLQVRAQHRKLASPFDQIGYADISTHVNWTSLIEAAQSAGARLIGLTDQHYFLTGILSELIAESEVQELSAADKRALQTLLHPEMMGRSFQALALAKDFSGALSGFRFIRSHLPLDR